MRYIFGWFLLTVSSFVAATTHEQQHLELQIGTDPHSGNALVRMTFQGDADGSTELRFSRWAGLENLSDHLERIQVRNSDGAIFEIMQQGKMVGWSITIRTTQ